MSGQGTPKSGQNIKKKRGRKPNSKAKSMISSYIPMISSSVKTSNINMDKNKSKCYDGIIGISECVACYPFIILFQPNYTHEQCESSTFVANQYVPTYSIRKYIEYYPFLYCWNKHGITSDSGPLPHLFLK